MALCWAVVVGPALRSWNNDGTGPATVATACYSVPQCELVTVTKLRMPMHITATPRRWHTMVHITFTEAVAIHRMGRTLAAEAGDTQQEAAFTRCVGACGWVHAVWLAPRPRASVCRPAKQAGAAIQLSQCVPSCTSQQSM